MATEALDGFAGADAPFELVCLGIRRESGDAKSYSFGRAGNAPVPFRPGQFLNFTFGIDGGEVARSYSISSSSAVAGRISITVKRVRGGVVSNWLFDNFRVGDRVKAEGPFGAFTDEDVSGPLLFLSAGSGITPVASMIRSYVDLCDDRDVAFVHFARSPQDMIFASEYAAWARAMTRSRFMAVATRPESGAGWVGPTGRVSEALLGALVPDVARRAVFCCGPEGFMETARAIVALLGVPPDRIFEESFTALPTAEIEESPSAASHEVHFAKSGQTVPCGHETTVLRAAQSAKVSVQTSCGKGVCGTCRVRLVSGTVSMSHAGGIKQREIDNGFILACCSRPTSDVVIDR